MKNQISIEDQIIEVGTNPNTSISDKIRALAAMKVKTAEIAKLLGIRYQHATNVLANDERKKKIKKG